MNVTGKHVFETKILGESVRLSCDVSEERLQKISACIEETASQVQKAKRGLAASTPLFKLLVNVNLADGWVTAQEQNAKHKTKIASLEKSLAKAQQDLKDYEKLLEDHS